MKGTVSMSWLLSNGIVALQLLMIFTILIGVIVLVQWKWTTKQLYEDMAAERQVSLAVLERKAEELATETARIAATHARELTTELGRLFDAVGQSQTEIKAAVEKTGQILEQELQKPDTSETTRATIEAIKVSTDKIEAPAPTSVPLSDERRHASRQNDTSRTECYQRVRDVMKEGVERYYQSHPGLYHDDRSKEAMRVSVQGLEKVFAILSEYPIGERYRRTDSTRKNVELTP